MKMLGHTEVSEPKGSHVVRDAIHTLRFHLQIQQGMSGHSGSKLRKVDIQISINGLKVLDSKSKMVLFNHPLHKISFCADDKQVDGCMFPDIFISTPYFIKGQTRLLVHR